MIGPNSPALFLASSKTSFFRRFPIQLPRKACLPSFLSRSSYPPRAKPVHCDRRWRAGPWQSGHPYSLRRRCRRDSGDGAAGDRRSLGAKNGACGSRCALSDPVSTVSPAELSALLPRPCLLLAADAAGATSYDACDLVGPIAVVVGSEGNGLSAATLMLDPLLISIPLISGLESLNAGVAGSIILFEASRQRRAQGKILKTLDSG